MVKITTNRNLGTIGKVNLSADNDVVVLVHAGQDFEVFATVASGCDAR